MFQYILRRIITSIPVLFGILLVTFSMARVIPGDPCRAILGEKATDAVCERFIREKGLDQPILTQFGIYLKEIGSGEFGQSFRFGMPVTRLLAERLPTTVELSFAALIIAVIVGIPLGIISAVKHNSWVDVATMVWANIGVSMPVFWLGLMLAYIFSLLLKDTPFWLPPSGRISPGIPSPTLTEVWGWNFAKGSFLAGLFDFIGRMNILNALLTGNWTLLKDALQHMILPAAALGTIPMALIARMARSSMLDVLGQDYIRTARAKGLSYRTVVLKHAFRNSLLPLVTVIGLSLGSLLGGAVLTETIFGLSGVGRTLYEAITARDYGIVQAFTVVIAVFFVLLNLIVDISYAYLDPRIRLN
ncbi:MAG: peptide ABC transporter permease [Anaerolineaceae bacterium]|jgi:peptide/nickel transport system permease protein|nr:ABC transporter permease [Anaerolineae bacterium]MBL1173330.1 ABC transporter permease [Chloroflexota bacterium]MBV6465654.1 Dipeptide transport system permease protein DppB [Anaerolineales bacterium]MCE7904596.1 ABC transporter permease [Anaerolineae bacterium CFX3]MDL1926786.1 ABC transporter permease [Anaerolineae bacterium AMX1]OQY81579.1 MAG: peptide ABC transporter permease [Anaerolineae bacterium UTCFX3]GER78292.1 peptide ABC transporter permease [Candidatus Denitrolinea symbiosum]